MNKEKVYCINCKHHNNPYYGNNPEQCFIYNEYINTYVSHFKSNLNRNGECELYEAFYKEKEDVA